MKTRLTYSDFCSFPQDSLFENLIKEQGLPCSEDFNQAKYLLYANLGIRHQSFHVGIDVDYWNKVVKSVNSLEGKYCTLFNNCATDLQEYAKAISNYYMNEAGIKNTKFDIEDYTDPNHIKRVKDQH